MQKSTRNTILLYGFLSGLINIAHMVYLGSQRGNPDFSHSLLLGYATMAIALSFVFVGVYQVRKKLTEQVFPFRMAFLSGLLISLLSGLMYVTSWMAVNKWMYPEFMADYVQYEFNQLKLAGASSKQLAEYLTEMNFIQELYQNPLLAFAMTLAEILPMGFVFSVIAAFIFKRK